MKMMLSLILAALALFPSGAAQTNFNFAAAWNVTNGMRTNQLVELMGGAPTRIGDTQAVGAELWVWEAMPTKPEGTIWERNPRATSDFASFAVYQGEVVQKPLKGFDDKTSGDREALFWRRSGELREEVERLRKETIRVTTEDEARAWEKARREMMEREKRAEAKRAAELDDYIKSYRSGNPAIARAMRAGKLAIGMTQVEVQMIWGAPLKKISTVSTAGESSVWEYERAGSVSVNFADGMVVSWTVVE